MFDRFRDKARHADDTRDPDIAYLFAPTEVAREGFWDELQARIAREVDRQKVPVRDNAGSLDGDDDLFRMHVADVRVEHQGTVRIADLETLDAHRTADVLARVQQVIELHADARDGG